MVRITMERKESVRRIGAGNEFSRRRALGLAPLPWLWPAPLWSAPDGKGLVRLAISESVAGDVNLNDARAAMMVWIRRMGAEINLAIDPNLFATTHEILTRMRRGELDAVALNALEYRQIASLLDSSHIVTAAGAAGWEQYVLLVKQSSGVRQLGELKGRRLFALKTPRMCVAPVWLSTLLAEGRHATVERFFASVVNDAKFSRVVLPVFFGQADACLTSRRGFETMCELNPQVGRDLKVLASSPTMVVQFYMFRKNYESSYRDRVIKAMSSLRTSASGQQLATLFQFEQLEVRDATCLTSVLAVLEQAERARAQETH